MSTNLENFDYSESFVMFYTSNDGELVHHISIDTIIDLYFIEDIYSFNITGRLRFIDKKGLLEYSMLTGQEYFTIIWGPAGNEIELNLYVYKINDISRSKGIQGINENYIDLFLVDEYFNNLHAKSHSISFNNGDNAINISNIIYNIVDKFVLKDDDNRNDLIEITDTNESNSETDNLDNYYTGMRTPAENIRWLLPRARERHYDNPGYLFYNSIQSSNQEPYTKFYCNTLEYLLNQNTEQICEPGYDHKFIFEPENQYYVNKILDYKINRPDNRALKKLISSRVLGFDPYRKKFIDISLNIDKALDKFTILGNHTLFRNNFELEEVEETFELEGDNKEYHLENIWYDNWIKQYCLQQTITLLLKGYNKRRIGSMIEILWPPFAKEDVYHKQLSGKCLIKSITHHFSITNPSFYIQKLVCIKNGYEELPENNSIIDAKKTNLGLGVNI